MWRWSTRLAFWEKNRPNKLVLYRKSPMRDTRAPMRPLRSILLIFAALTCGHFARAQTVINSTFVDRYPETNFDLYGNPDNWMPAEVPNNTPGKQFNVTIGDLVSLEITFDVDATVSNLTLPSQRTEYFSIEGKSFTVTGTTSIASRETTILVWSSPNAPGPAKFDAGNLSKFSDHTLTGVYHIGSQYSTGPATLQFNGADIWKLADAYVSLTGPLATVVDQFGNDALRNLARLENSILYLQDHEGVTNAPFFNAGSLGISQFAGPATFTAAAGLSNFDPATRTITGGSFHLYAGTAPVELRFNGADVVNLASEVSLRGATARIADLTGNDGLRNFARILPAGSLTLYARNLTIPGQFQNDGSLSLFETATFLVNGAFTNFDSATRTFSGGNVAVSRNAQLKFAGADIVHNASSITLSDGGTITDLAGNDGLRNFNDNLSSGSFTVGSDSQFTAPGNFTNSGTIVTIRRLFSIHQSAPEGRFTVPPGSGYTQTSGLTINDGLLSAEHIDIMGGEFSGGGTVHGNVMVANATIAPSASTKIEGDLTLSAGSHFRSQLNSEPQDEISGKVTLAGILEVDIPSDAFVSSTSFLTVLKSATPLTGVFSNAPNGARIPTSDGTGSVVVFYDSKSVSVTQYQAAPPPAQLLNISSRAFLSRADDDPFSDRSVLIGGFIITGTTEPKEVVLRGLGPSLAKFGLSPVLADPVLELHASDGGLLATNDNWRETQPNEIIMSGLAPDDDREAALRITLQPGTYTVVIKEKNGFAGHGLVEIYDLSQNSSSKLANISTRGYTDSSNLLIGGIIAAGNGQANAEIVVRAIGPQLRQNGIFNALDDPTLELRDANGVVVAFNDDWLTNSDQLTYTGLTPFDGTESAMRVSLPRGTYTAIVRAKGNSGGVALVEFYDLRR